VNSRRILDTSTLQVTRETPFIPLTAVPEPSTKVRRRKSGVVYADRAPCGLSEGQIAEFRRRLAKGYYNAPGVQEEVVRRMLQGSDLDFPAAL
jgi:hypothetical protein